MRLDTVAMIVGVYPEGICRHLVLTGDSGDVGDVIVMGRCEVTRATCYDRDCVECPHYSGRVVQ